MENLVKIFNEIIQNPGVIHSLPLTKQNMLSNLSEIITKAYLSTDNIIRKEAEKELEMIQSQNIEEHLADLFYLIYNINNENSNLEERVIIYTSSVLRKIINYFKVGDISIIIRLIGLNILCLFKERLFIKNRMKLSVALEFLINLSYLGEGEGKTQAIMILLGFLEKSFESENALSLSKSLSEMLMIKALVHQIFENTLITHHLNLILNKVLLNLKYFHNLLFNNLSSSNYNYQIENLEILILITDTISILFQKALKNQEYLYLKNFIENKECLDIFLKIFMTPMTKHEINIIMIHENEDLVNAINNIKYNIIHSSKILHNYFSNTEENLQINKIFNEPKNIIFGIFNEAILKYIIEQFKFLFSNKNLIEIEKLIEVY